MTRICGALWLLIALGVATRTQAAEKPILVLDAGGHTADVKKVLFSRDGKELISVSEDKTIRLWDVSSGETLRTLRPPIGTGQEGKLYAAALNPDGTTLAVGGFGFFGGNPIHLLSLVTGRIEQVLSGHENTITDLAFSSDGGRLISACGDQTARIWNVNNGTTEHVLRGHTNRVYGVAFSPDGQRCATASFDHTAAVWDVATGQRLATLKGHSAEVICVAWRPDGLVLATGSLDHSIRLWSPDSKSYKGFDNLGELRISSVTFTADSKRLLYTSFGNGRHHIAAVLDVVTGREVSRFSQHLNTILHGTLSQDGRLAATVGGDDSEILIWSTADATRRQELRGRGRAPWATAWSPDGVRIAWGDSNDGGTGINRLAPLKRTFDLTTLEFGSTPDASFVRAKTERGSLSLVPGPTNQVGYVASVLVRQGDRTLVTLAIPDPYDEIRCSSFLPGDMAAVGTNSNFWLYEARTGKQFRALQGHTGVIWAVSPSPDGRYLLSASADMTLRVWSPDAKARARTPREAFPQNLVEPLERLPDFAKLLDLDDGIRRVIDEAKKLGWEQNAIDDLESFKVGYVEPLLSCFFAGDDWIIWTPDGYYAASPGGEKLMGWHVNNGREQMASFYPASQFRSTLYRPDVIKLLLKTGSVERALEEADKARGRMTVKTDASQVLPPQVRITSPSVGHKAPQSEIEVRATAMSVGNHPVTALRLLLDGRPYQGLKGVQTIADSKAGEVSRSWQIELEPGKHKLKVLADSAVSQGVSEEIEVVYIGGDSEPVQLPKLYLVAIGISEYPGELKLNYAAKDAEALGSALKSHSKSLFRDIEVQTITDATATRAGMLKGLSWLRGQMTQNDYGIFFFAGHGDLDNDSALYFLPVDADTKDLVSSAVPADQVKRVLSGIPGKLITIFDACHSAGIAGSQTGKRRAGSTSLTDDLVRDLVTDENGVIAMCSSTGREFSLENNEFRQGSFTLSIVEGLSGKADFNKDGVVYLNELDTYVTDRVKELTKGQQHPVTAKPGSIRSFPLAKP